MNGIEGIGAAGLGPAIQQDAGTLAPAGASASGSSQFLTALVQGMDQVQADSANASNALATLATRPDVATHDVILAMEQARLSLQLAGEVRQRLVDAYKEITGMQI
jgi:flagellar hook-basal body complex protein FliE